MVQTCCGPGGRWRRGSACWSGTSALPNIRPEGSNAERCRPAAAALKASALDDATLERREWCASAAATRELVAGEAQASSPQLQGQWSVGP